MGKGSVEACARYRLSPNEVEQLSKDEIARRRKLRLVQVREQSKVNAAKIRIDVKKEKTKQLNKLACEIKNNLEKEKMEKVKHLERQYENSLKSIGSAHRAAIVKDSLVDKMLTEQHQKEAADDRYKTAIQLARREKTMQEYQDNKHIIARKAALETEMLRAVEISSRPPPLPDPVEEALRAKPKAVPLTDMNAFSTTHYHIPDYAVVKAGPCEQVDARESAEDEDLRLKQELKEKRQADREKIIRARIRGNEALRKEHLRHEYTDMLQDLSLMQKADRRRRQDIVADLPRQVFIHPDRRLEDKETKQRDMEKAFEDMYLPDKHPPVLMNLDRTSPDTPGSDNTEDTPQEARSLSVQQASRNISGLKDATRSTVDPESKLDKKNESALMKLLHRIKEQKHEHATRSVIETSQLGETSRPPPQDEGSQSNGLSPLSEVSLPPSNGISPQLGSAPQVVIEIRSPRGQMRRERTDAQTMATPENMTEAEKTAWQIKLIQLEQRQKELDQLISKFKDMTGLTEDGMPATDNQPSSIPSLSSSEPVPQAVGLSDIPPRLEPTSNLMQQGHGLRTTAPYNTGHLIGQSTGQMMGQTTSYPSGIYHARPVQISEKESNRKMESGYGSGIPGASFRGYQGLGSVSGIRHPESSTSLTARDMASHTLGLAHQADHVKRVREYQERVVQNSQKELPSSSFSLSNSSVRSESSSLGSSVDSDLARKVKEYQRKILTGNTERRNFLAETRANIERQRQDLYRRYPLTMQTGGVHEAPEVKSTFADSQPDSLADRILAEIRDPYRPRSLDMSDIRTDRESVPSQDVVPTEIGAEKLSTSQMSTSSSKSRLERIKKSLLFDDIDESLTRTPGHDISLMAPSDLEEGDVTLTSSSERGSPNLSKSSKSDCGMSLLSRARESGSVFERRQEELQQQLQEVQKQKEEILQRYHLGQQMIQNSKSVQQSKFNLTGSSSDDSSTWRSALEKSGGDATSYVPPIPQDGNLRSQALLGAGDFKDMSRGDYEVPLTSQDFATTLSSLGGFPRSLEQFSLLDSLGSGKPGSSLTRSDEMSMSMTNRRSSPGDSNGKPFSDLEEESLSQISSNISPPVLAPWQLINGHSGGSASIEEESLTPESRISVTESDSADPRITWTTLLTGVPTASSEEEDNGFRTVGQQPTEYVPHDLSTIFEMDTPTTVGRNSGQFVGLRSTLSSI